MPTTSLYVQHTRILKFVNRAGALLGRVGVRPPRLEAARILETAHKQASFAYDDPAFVEGLKRLVKSVREEAELTAFGKVAVRRFVQRAATTRCLVEREIARNPRILEERIEEPVFMGCSVGGLLALDLAARHPDRFRAVISLEGALRIGGDIEDFSELWHPQVSNEYKARLMDSVMAPTSPKAYRKETSFVYSSGWPPAFLGDLYYYVVDYDLTDRARDIDTNRVGVHILSGEYDYSGTPELGHAAHQAIPGSTWQEMKGMGHFPMSENPERFVEYLLPVLQGIGEA